MKILMLCNFYNESLEFQENLLTKYYTKHGHQVVVVTSTYDSVFDYYADNHNNSVPAKTYFDGDTKIIKLRYRFNILNRLRAFPSIKNILEQEKPDLIYVHGIMLNMLEAVKYKKKNDGCIMILDSHADYGNSGKNWFSITVLHGIIRKWYLDRSRKHISKIFSVIPSGLKFLNEVYKVPYDQMELLPLGADIDLGREVLKSGKFLELKKKYNIANGSKVIVTGGKLSVRKKTELLIGAVNKLNMSDVYLLVIGDSAEEDLAYKTLLIKEAGKNKNIHLVGWLNRVEVYEHFAISDMAIFPASQSILWQQAISMGLPLVVGKMAGQTIEYLNLYNNIIILEPHEICQKIIQEKIEEVLFNPSTLSLMREGALRVTEECLDWNHLIERTLRFNTDKVDR